MRQFGACDLESINIVLLDGGSRSAGNVVIIQRKYAVCLTVCRKGLFMPVKANDLSGQTFGRFKVLNFSHKKGGRFFYKCLCSCGTEVIVRSDAIKSQCYKPCKCLGDGKFKNLLGHQFGRWKVIERVENDKLRRSMWKCKCDCGNIKIVPSSALRRGQSKSCGCFHNELASKNAIERFTKHGMYGTPAYKSWKSMIGRLNDSKRYDGERVVKRWVEKFENFYNDMGEPPIDKALSKKKGHPVYMTLGQIVSHKGYRKSNCEWQTSIQQANNTSRNLRFKGFGKEQTLTQWAREYNMKTGTLRRRLVDFKWSLEKSVTKPIRGVYVSRKSKPPRRGSQ